MLHATLVAVPSVVIFFREFQQSVW
jgi:hypothetical protein